MSLVVVGSVAFDAIETPFGKTDKILGGAGTFISLASSYFAEPKIISVVGGDFPEQYIKLLEKHNVNTEGLQIKKQEKTFFWKGIYHNDMNSRDTIVTELNVLENFNPIIPDSYQGADFLMLGNLSPVVQRQVIKRFKKRPKIIAMDTMNFWMNNSPDELLKTIELTDVLIINDEEARQLSKEYSLVKAAKKILALGPKYLVIKKGEHGALLFDKKEVFFAPALPLEDIFDPTGAGDTFAGGFIGYLAKNSDISFENMKRAVIYGSAMASFCVEKFGTEKLIGLSQKEITQRVMEFIDLVQFNYKLRDLF
ncbi:sugar kinase [Candidatus Altiarchaeales archaeon WOR_SM1_SCG]|nr:sugar kinase [Candidatus Altiarchaeales archaeon WOR_SM1_SCG]